MSKAQGWILINTNKKYKFVVLYFTHKNNLNKTNYHITFGFNITLMSYAVNPDSRKLNVPGSHIYLYISLDHWTAKDHSLPLIFNMYVSFLRGVTFHEECWCFPKSRPEVSPLNLRAGISDKSLACFPQIPWKSMGATKRSTPLKIR